MVEQVSNVRISGRDPASFVEEKLRKRAVNARANTTMDAQIASERRAAGGNSTDRIVARTPRRPAAGPGPRITNMRAGIGQLISGPSGGGRRLAKARGL
jgi:hypothetical protein